MFPPRLNTSQKIYVEAKMKILQMTTKVIQKVKVQSWQRGPNPLFYEDPPTLPTSPLFQILPNPPLSLLPPTPTSTALLLFCFLAKWEIAPHFMCYFT